MIKVGEHITIDFLGVKKDYSPEFYEKVIYNLIFEGIRVWRSGFI